MVGRPYHSTQRFVCKCPLFNEVYQSVLETYPNFNKHVKLYIDDSVSINALAIGKNMIAVTQGAIDTLSEDELKGVIAHEFGHIVNGDTKALLLNVVGNGIFSIWILTVKIILWILVVLTGLTGEGPQFLAKIFRSAILLVISIFLFIGQIILSINSRQNEYSADECAYRIGYGSHLLEALYVLHQISTKRKLNIFEKLNSSHPHIADRIGRLERL